MANYISLQLSNNYSDAPSAWAGQLGGTGTTKYYDEDAQATTGLVNGDIVLNSQSASDTFNGNNSFYYAIVDSTTPAVFQVDASGVISNLDFTVPTTTTTSTTTGLPTFDCTDANVAFNQNVSGSRTGSIFDVNDVTVSLGTVTGFSGNASFALQSGQNDYDIDILVPATGYTNSAQTITCQASATGVDRAISFNDSTALTFDDTGTPIQTKQFTIDNANTETLDVNTDIGYSSGNNNWVNLNVSQGSQTGGTLNISLDPNTGTQPRSIAITLKHPEDPNNVQSPTSVTITQAGGDAIPTVGDYSITMTNNGQGADFVELDFSAAQGSTPWSGDAVSDAEDTLDQDLRIEISSLSGLNGSLYDITDAGQTNALSVGDQLDQNSGAPTLRYYPNTGFSGAQATFRYRAVDTGGNNPEAEVTITVNGPQNQAPQLSSNSIGVNVQGYGTTQQKSDQFNLGLFVSDETPDDNLTWEFCDANGNNATAFASQTLTSGTLTYNSSLGVAVFTYQYTGPDLNPNSSIPPEPSIFFKVTDPQGATSSVGTINFQISGPNNAAPIASPNNEPRALLQYDSVQGNISQYVTDADGDTLSYSINSQSNQGQFTVDNNGDWTYSSGTTWDITPGQSEIDVVEVLISDGFGGTEIYTITFTVTGVSYVQIEYSANASTSDNACNNSQDNIGYLDITQAININGLSSAGADHYIYSDPGFLNPVTSTVGAPWISVFQNINGTPTLRSVQLDSNGVITSVLNCQVATNNAWPLTVNYNTDAGDLCNEQYETAVVWQNLADGLNLQQVYTQGGQLFSNEFYANQYVNATAPSGVTVPSGFYTGDGITASEYYEYADGQFTGSLQTCPQPVNYVTYSFQASYLESDREDITAACLNASTLTQATLWFRAPDNAIDPNSSDQDLLLYVMRNQLVVFTSEAGATALDYDQLWDTTVFFAIPTIQGKFAKWENDNSSGYSGNFRWYGVDPDDIDNLEVGVADTVLGTCATEFQRPALSSNFCLGFDNYSCSPIFGSTRGQTSKTNLFYAFLECSAKFEGGEPYWNMYVIDGLHTSEENSTSYIKELVEVLYATGGPTTIGGDTLIGCMTFAHKVFGLNIEGAVASVLAETEYNGQDIRVIPINPIDLGFTSGATIGYGYTSCAECEASQSSPSSFTLDVVDEAEVINRSIPNFDLETNYNLDNLSKPLLRTNPKLSSNAKLVTNSQGKMFIESIDATKELASVEYKKWSVSKDGQWSYDLPKFFSYSKTPSDQIYSAKTAFSDFTVQESFDKQIEEDYHYGTTYNYSKLHDEDFRMMAPIWLDKNIPSKFVIFKVSDPSVLDFDATSNYDNMSTILLNSEIIKTFDLTRKSELGTYIRNHVQSELFPKNPITVNFDSNERTSFNGIDIKKGGFTSKGEYLEEDFVRKDQTIIEENDLITGGFERNGLVCANIMNLEFLFNDPTADVYGINRYFGLYVDDVDSGYGSLESANSGALKFKLLNSDINEDSSSAIPPFNLIRNTPTIGYAHVVNSGAFYKISPKSFYDSSRLEVLVEDSINSIASEVKLAPTGRSIDAQATNETGSDFIKINVVDNPAVNDRFGIFPSKEQLYRIKFARFNQGDQFKLFTRYSNTPTIIELGADLASVLFTIRIALNSSSAAGGNLIIEKESDNSITIAEKEGTLQPLELRIEPNSGLNKTLARVEELQVPYDLSNNMFFGSDSLPAGHFSSTSFSNQGTNSEIASAIVKAINAADNGFTALTYDKAEYFYVKTNVVGYRLLGAGINIPNNNANNFLSIDNAFKDVDNLLRLYLAPNSNNLIKDSTIYYFNGGHAAGKSMLVTLDSVEDINVGDFIETRSSGVYNEVLDIVDDIERLPEQYKKIILKRVNSIESGEIEVFADALVRLGLFSAYDVHDMNFDFYDKSNSKLKELQYETFEDINYEPERETTSDIYPFGDRDNTDYTLDPERYFTGLSDILREETADEFDENIIESEYDRLQENYLKELAINSRVVPTINKWVLKDSMTVREQPYYLNANEAFGRSNFSADMSVSGRDRLGMTHEWFYVNNLPKHLIQNQGTDTDPSYRLNDSFSYVNFMEGFEITPDLFKSNEFNYFDRFFVTEGFETKGDNNYKTFVKTNRQKKYTLVDNGNDLSFADTIFKGIKVTFKNRKEFTASSPVDFIKSPEFNGYKFSILLNVKTAQESNGIEYEVIQNKKFKFCLFFISLNLDDLWADQTLTKKLLYELNHSLVWDNEASTFKYSDIKIDGAFNLNELNQDNPQAADYLQLGGITHQDGTVPQYLEQINKNDDDEFGKLRIKIQTAFGPQLLQAKIEKIEGQDLLKLASPIKDITNGETGAPDANLGNLPGYLQWNAEYTYIEGGINAYKFILDSLGIQNMANMLLREPNNITYTTVNMDGSIENNKFIILFEDGVEIIKESSLVTVADTDKPESFKLFSGNIGYNLENSFEYYPFLIRHNGGYTIDTTPVVTFTDVYAHMKTNTLQSTANTGELLLEEQMYKHSLSNIDEINLARDYYRKYNRCGVAFNLGFIFDGGSHDTAWGQIKNHFYRKVNEFNASGVTKLSTSSDKLPLYPLIGEIAIDKKDVHVFRSSWDKNYYTRSVSGGGSEKVPGTFETKEEKSYLASTIMQVANDYTLLDFNTQIVKTEEEQDDILLNNTNDSDIVMFEDDDRIILDFYIDYTITKRLSNDGVLSAITEYVLPIDSAEDKTTLKDDARLYIDKNLVNVFGVSQIKLFTKRIKGVASSLESVSNVDGLDNGGYIADQNFSFKAHEQKPLNFRLIYNKRLGYSYRIRPMVKIKS